MKILFTCSLLIVTLFSSCATQENDTINKPNSQVATVSPISHSMTQALLESTNIDVVFLPPKRLPINRIPSWLNKNRNQHFEHFDAFVSIRSIRPELDFYTSLRKENIRIVPIDIAKAMIPAGEEVAIDQPDDMFWLNPNNALLMLGMLKRDLIALWPEYHTQIETNFVKNSQGLRAISLQFDDILLDKQYEVIINQTNNTLPFSNSLMLPSMSVDESIGFNAVLISNKTSPNTWQIDDFTQFNAKPFLARWQTALDQLNALPDVAMNE